MTAIRSPFKSIMLSSFLNTILYKLRIRPAFDFVKKNIYK